MFPGFGEPARVSVAKFEIERAIELVRALPCVDMRCKNAGAVGSRTCARCVALEHLETMEKRT